MEKVQNLYMLNSKAFLIINSILNILNFSIRWTRQFTNLPPSTYSVRECMSSPIANLEKMAKRKSLPKPCTEPLSFSWHAITKQPALFQLTKT